MAGRAQLEWDFRVEAQTSPRSTPRTCWNFTDAVSQRCRERNRSRASLTFRAGPQQNWVRVSRLIRECLDQSCAGEKSAIPAGKDKERLRSGRLESVPHMKKRKKPRAPTAVHIIR